MKLYRRDFLIKMGTGILAGLFTSTQAHAFQALFKSTAPEIQDKNNPSFDIFYRLCQWVTYRENLDKEIAKKVYDIFLVEPWGKHHISSTYTTLKKAIEKDKDKTDIAALLKDKKIKDGEAWFISHLMVTWYLGVYYHEKMPDQRIMYEEALMHEAIEGIAPIRLVGSTPYGDWYDIPKGIEK